MRGVSPFSPRRSVAATRLGGTKQPGGVRERTLDELQLLFEVADTSWDGLWLVDLDGTVLRANREMQQICGTTQAGGPVWRFLPTTEQDAFRARLQEVRDGGDPLPAYQQVVIREDGAQVTVQVEDSVHHDREGRPAALLQRFVDARRSEALWRAQRRGEVHLSADQVSDRLGHWTWDLATNRMDLGPWLSERFPGVRVLEPLTGEAALSMWHEDDRATVEAAFGRLYADPAREAVVSGRLLEGEVWRWVSCRVRAVTDGTGTITSFSGDLADVDDTVTTELELRDQVAQNGLMHAVSVAANGALTFDELCQLGRVLILAHDDWTRGRIFLVTDGAAVPHYVEESDRRDDEANPHLLAADLELASVVLASGEMRWNEPQRLSIGTPVFYDGGIWAVIVTTSEPPLYRHGMIEEFAQHMAMQAERVIEREQTALALTRAHDAAMDASRQKSLFLATLTHEIRNPLNGLLGVSELLLDTSLTEDQERLVRAGQDSGQTLLALINDTLDLSKAEAGQLTLERVPFSLREVIANVVEPAAARAARDGVVVEARYGDVADPVLGDPIRVTQVVANLVSNAVKFTPEGRVVVDVRTETVGERLLLRCEVTDTGVGISPHVADLFEPYRQAGTDTTRRFGGTGLGLAICREIVEAMGGEIGYESTPGQGSRFAFTAVLDKASSDQVAEALPVATQGARILVVDDEPVNLLVAEGMLAGIGHEVTTADGGAAMLDLIEDETFDLVLVDVHMPGLDGPAVTELVRDREGESRLPIVGMTGAGSPADLDRCLASGMDEVVIKPVTLEVLAATVDRLLAG